VGNLPYHVKQDDVEQHFAQCGEIYQVRLPIDRDTGQSKGFAFIELEAAAAERARHLDGTKFEGRNLRVRDAEPMHPR
jgi:RNA recognition motif-containing protein